MLPMNALIAWDRSGLLPNSQCTHRPIQTEKRQLSVFRADDRLSGSNPQKCGSVRIGDHPQGKWREKLGDQNRPQKGLGCSILSSRILMKPSLFALCTAFAFCSLSAQQPVWQPSPGHTQISIWPGAAPDPQSVRGPGYLEKSG